MNPIGGGLLLVCAAAVFYYPASWLAPHHPVLAVAWMLFCAGFVMSAAEP